MNDIGQRSPWEKHRTIFDNVSLNNAYQWSGEFISGLPHVGFPERRRILHRYQVFPPSNSLGGHLCYSEHLYDSLACYSGF